MTPNVYDLGDLVTLTGRFYSDVLLTTPADPTTVVLTLRSPSGVLTTPSPTHAATGVWTYTWQPNASGLWEANWTGTGANAAASQEPVFVRAGITTGNDLCSVDAVRLFLQKESADVDQDAEIQVLITAVSAQITEYCSREFIASTNATRRFRVNGCFVDLSPYDLRNTTSGIAGITVSLNPETTSPTTLVANTDYVLEPLSGALGGTYLDLRLSTGFGLTTGTTFQNFGYALLDVTADWGMSSIPTDVTQACVEAVAIRLRRDVSAFSTTFNLDESRLERPSALPSSVCQALRVYRRITV